MRKIGKIEDKEQNIGFVEYQLIDFLFAIFVVVVIIGCLFGIPIQRRLIYIFSTMRFLEIFTFHIQGFF
jgi:hypothetical protein